MGGGRTGKDRRCGRNILRDVGLHFHFRMFWATSEIFYNPTYNLLLLKEIITILLKKSGEKCDYCSIKIAVIFIYAWHILVRI